MYIMMQTGVMFEARITSEHSMSSYGQPVLVAAETVPYICAAGEVISPAEAARYDIIGATEDDIAALRRGGYSPRMWENPPRDSNEAEDEE